MERRKKKEGKKKEVGKKKGRRSKEGEKLEEKEVPKTNFKTAIIFLIFVTHIVLPI